MKKIVFIAAAVAALAACDNKADEAPVAADTPVAETTPMAEETGVAAGTYDVKSADGRMGKTVINTDGTYEDTDVDGKVTKGTYARRDGKDCFTPDTGDPEMCWTVTAPGADGSFTATSADGKTIVTVTPAGTVTTATDTTAS